MIFMADTVTRIINAALNIIFVGYPARTSLGALFGTFLAIGKKIFSPTISKISSRIDLASLTAWDFMFLGIALFHIPTFFSTLTNKYRLGENEEKAFQLIRRGVRDGQITEFQARDMYFNLMETILKNVDLKQSTKEEIKSNLSE